jgi:hypothetical protein
VQEEILEFCVRFLGDGLQQGDTAVLETLCAAARKEWGGRLGSLAPEDCSEAFVPACAFTALAAYVTARTAATPPFSFTAGDISLREERGTRETRETAAWLRKLSAELLRPYTGEGDFAFRGVRA